MFKIGNPVVTNIEGGEQMKKVLVLCFLIGVLGLVQLMPLVNACDKQAYLVSEQWPNGIVEVREEVQWLFVIVVGNGYAPGSSPGVVFEDVVVTDHLGAELEIDSPFPWWATQGTAEYYTTGKSDKVHLTWYVGDLTYMQFETLGFYVSTDINPAGNHEYTTPGEYYLNSGPEMKYKINGVQYSLTLNQLMVTVYGTEAD